MAVVTQDTAAERVVIIRLVVLYDEEEHVSQIHPIIENLLKLIIDRFGSRSKCIPPLKPDWEDQEDV
ncbi:MAG: hypothetical protein GY757_46945 [bacterium]|nr:hypothetical protein [bacterium]